MADKQLYEQHNLPQPDGICDGGTMDCGGGLLMAILHAIKKLDEGQILEIRSKETSVRNDLPAWCRMSGNDLLGTIEMADHVRFLVKKG